MMMKDLIFNIFGTYTPVMTDSYTTDGAFNGTVVASGMAGVDWPFVLGVLLFAVVLYSFFRLIGGLIKNG